RQVVARHGYLAWEPNAGEREALEEGLKVLGVATARRASRQEQGLPVDLVPENQRRPHRRVHGGQQMSNRAATVSGYAAAAESESSCRIGQCSAPQRTQVLGTKTARTPAGQNRGCEP